MTELQQSIFLNISRVSKYQSRSRLLSDPYTHFSRNRKEEIENEFELVDYQGKGTISKQEFVDYLNEKHRQIDLGLLDTVLKSMRWDYRTQIPKEQFVRIYLTREQQLFRQVNELLSLRQRMETTRQLFAQANKHNVRMYARIKVNKLFIRPENAEYDYDMLSLDVEYEDHTNKMDFLIEQPIFSPQHSNFELILPCQKDYIFVKYKFADPRSPYKDHLGQCYVNFPLKDVPELNSSGQGTSFEASHIKADITKNHEPKGYCEFTITFEADMDKVEETITEQQSYIDNAYEKAEGKQRQYEYLRYLWGIRHKSPYKITQQENKGIIVARLVLACLLILCSVVVQSLGRCEPMSFLLALILLKNWKYIILRNEKFLMTWLTILSMVLDFVWLSFLAGKESLINYMNLLAVDVFTYILLVVKVALLFYLIFIENSFSIKEDSSNKDEKY